MTFQDTRRLLNGGEAFLLMLQQFRIDDVTDARLALAEAYADNPVFRPKNVEVGVVMGVHFSTCVSVGLISNTGGDSHKKCRA